MVQFPRNRRRVDGEVKHSNLPPLKQVDNLRIRLITSVIKLISVLSVRSSTSVIRAVARESQKFPETLRNACTNDLINVTRQSAKFNRPINY